MTYIPEESKVIYRSKDEKKEKDFDAMEWIAAMPARRSCAKTGPPMSPTRESPADGGIPLLRILK